MRIRYIICAIAIIMSGVFVVHAEQTDKSYIPRTVLFTPSEMLAVKISPNGKTLAFVKGEPNGVMNIHISDTSKAKDTNARKQITHFDSPDIYRFFWVGNENIIFLRDVQGSKGYQICGVNVATGVLKNYTQDFKSISAKIFKVKGNKAAVGINDRNTNYHDVYILDVSTGALTKIYENDRFSRFTFNDDLQIVLQDEIHDDGSIDVYRNNELYMHFSPQDAFSARILDIHGSQLYYFDCRESDTTWLKAVDLKSGVERKLANNDRSDIGDVVFIHGEPFVYSTTWLEKEWHAFGKGDLSALQNKIGNEFQVTSQTDNLLTIRVDVPNRVGASFYLYDIENNKLTDLYIAKTHPQLSAMIPFTFETRDGFTLTAYLTLPKQYSSIKDVTKPIPLVIIPHGGPFQARNHLSFNANHQWLASRGYAVLSVNFRLSSGLGKKLVNAGNGEWGRKAQYDLIDGAQWCIEHGITTKDQVGIFGGSYGGYATLAGLAFTPTEFVVGVDFVGPSSLITVLQKLPKYWDWTIYPLSDEEAFFTKGAFITSMGGNPDTQQGKEFLATRSPVNYAKQISSPLLIVQGDNDPIVTKGESLQIFEALKQLDKKACLLSFPDEGHHLHKYPNVDVSLAYAEKWLHDALGGEFEPIDQKYMQQSSVKIQTTADSHAIYVHE